MNTKTTNHNTYHFGYVANPQTGPENQKKCQKSTFFENSTNNIDVRYFTEPQMRCHGDFCPEQVDYTQHESIEKTS